MDKIMCHAFCLCTLFATGVRGAIVQRPRNVATHIGGQAIVNCSSDITVDIAWAYTLDCNTAAATYLTAGNCVLNSTFAPYYRTETPGGFVCNLVVFDASLSRGGCYACADGVGPNRLFQAMLIIVDLTANITFNSTELIHGENVNISSSVSYRGPSLPAQAPPLPPSFYWTLKLNSSLNITSYPGLTTYTSASSNIIVTPQLPNVPSYLSNLFFNPPVNVPAGCADSAPTYRGSYYETPIQNVSYPPNNTNISGDLIACPNDDGPTVLTCSADGYPPPSYKWFDLTRGEVISESNTVTIQHDGNYQCVAFNTIRNVAYNASSRVANFSGCFHDPPCDTACIIMIVLVIFFGLNLLSCGGFMIYYARSESGRNQLNDRFPLLKKMLPCMNGEGYICSEWTFLFVFLSIFTGIVFFPVIVIMANCCHKNKKAAQELSARQTSTDANTL